MNDSLLKEIFRTAGSLNSLLCEAGNTDTGETLKAQFRTTGQEIISLMIELIRKFKEK